MLLTSQNVIGINMKISLLLLFKYYLFQMLSRLLEQCSLSFDPKSCRYKVEKAKESTARVTVWREYGVTRSYTMESTYCGFDQGPLKVRMVLQLFFSSVFFFNNFLFCLKIK